MGTRVGLILIAIRRFCSTPELDTCDGHQSHDRARYENRCCLLFNPEQAHELVQ